MKILVVDDSSLARKILIKELKKIEPSAQILEAENGAIAVEMFKNEKPAAVFLDLTMPVMDGYEALEHIMSLDPYAQVIIVSADIQPEARKKVLQIGAKNMCPKPINSEKMESIFMHDLII